MPRPGAAGEAEDAGRGVGALRGVPAEPERRAGPVRRRAGGRGHVRAAAADPGGADGGDQLRGARGVGRLGEAVLPGVRRRRVRRRRRAAAGAHGHQAQRRYRRRRTRARQRARLRRRRAAPTGHGRRGGPAVRPPRFLIESGLFFRCHLGQCVPVHT